MLAEPQLRCAGRRARRPRCHFQPRPGRPGRCTPAHSSAASAALRSCATACLRHLVPPSRRSAAAAHMARDSAEPCGWRVAPRAPARPRHQPTERRSACRALWRPTGNTNASHAPKSPRSARPLWHSTPAPWARSGARVPSAGSASAAARPIHARRTPPARRRQRARAGEAGGRRGCVGRLGQEARQDARRGQVLLHLLRARQLVRDAGAQRRVAALQQLPATSRACPA
jgi:hypothetical protein